MKHHKNSFTKLTNPCGKAIAIALLCLGCLLGHAVAQGGELRFCLRTEPKTFDPLKGRGRRLWRDPLSDGRRAGAHQPPNSGTTA